MEEIDIKTVSWQESRLELEAVRVTVFVEEQNVPVDLEMDDRDALCVHALVQENDRPVGAGRIDLLHQGKVGRVAVLRTCRGRGIGKAMMSVLEATARQAGLAQVWLNAQISAQSFYESLGYETSGDPFLEADILHCRMQKTLQHPPPSTLAGE